ncbi:MAG TPA: hypothetical protein VMB91_11525 [Solirubrobacteraceae bacterium]|nr:hypothetical protein [Solirubrobacteraceae bacterium]
MDIAIALLTVALLALVVRFVGAPLHARARPEPSERDAERDALEAAREAKYREIRDLELDYRTGKLSPEDYQAIDAQLRSEAIQILDRIERAEAEAPGDASEGSGAG